MLHVVTSVATTAVVASTAIWGQGAAPKFYVDDPIVIDRDTALDASGARPIELSEYYDFLENTFGSRDDTNVGRALNVNTLDEVPDSSWFTNRVGRRSMSIAEIVRGPDRIDRLAVSEWLIVAGKSPGGFQPGFRATDPSDPSGQIYQLEVDPERNPEMASGAEIIGTALYHAIGYNVVDVYLVDVDPKRIRISERATIRDASGTRRFVQSDLDEVLRLAARHPDGRYRMTASRFAEGRNMGNFRYFGTRPDDPNDIYPHEHRRELRANRVFGAWVNHDDSRAINTLDMLVTDGGRSYIRHYMFDFGSILGSATRFADNARSGREYLLEQGSNLTALVTLGLWAPRWSKVDVPDDLPAAVGRIEGDAFQPEQWKAEYPNAAFANLGPDDAFWGARIVAAFSDDAIRAVVGKARYSDPRATDYLTGVLIKRRDRIARTWLTALNPLVDFVLSPSGTLTFDNVAVRARAATPAAEYVLSWSRFDNATDRHDTVGDAMTITETRAEAPKAVLSGSDYIAVAVRSRHPDHAAWQRPVRAYFRRTEGGWRTVGIERE